MRAVGFALLLAAWPAAADNAAPPAGAQSLLARWLDAQNRGDFAAYQKLYARGFHGVRRSGERAVELDRAGWMRDRERMFKRPMTVEASEVEVSPRPGGFGLAFVQSFTSGDYRDRGRKVMEAVVEQGALVIAREELLASDLDEELRLLRALYPGYRPSDRRIAADDETRVAEFHWHAREDGGASGLVELRSETAREMELALFERHGTRRRVLARDRFSASGRDFELRARELFIARGDRAIEIEFDQDEENWRNGDGWKRHVSLWRRDGDQLTVVFDTIVGEDGPSCECVPVRAAEVSSARRGDGWDVVEEITDNVNACKGQPRKRRVVHRWDGAAYQ